MNARFLFIPVLILLITMQQCSKDSNSPDRYFSPQQQRALIRQSIYYSVKLPPGATRETRFSPEFDWYYDVAEKEYDLRGLLPGKDSAYYFLMTRKARSRWPAREAIGGIVKLDKQYKLLEYEEVFRTWKMTEDTLNARAFELFNLMKDGKDLTPFRSKFKGDRYIEFPDDRFYFDKASRSWKDSALDSMRING